MDRGTHPWLEAGPSRATVRGLLGGKGSIEWPIVGNQENKSDSEVGQWKCIDTRDATVENENRG